MIERLLKHSWFPAALQIVSLVVFIGLILIGWGISSSDNTFLLTLRNTNLANLIVWCFWWPAVIFGAVVAGRLWCTVCPMELMQNVLNRIGIKKKPPRWMRSGWLITLLYGIILIIGVHTFAIHRVPHRMAIYMIILLGLTAIFALIYEKRAFCSYACPVGHLLGLYATVSATEWRVKDRTVCDSCKEKPCINKNRNNAWYGRACQSNLFPGSLKDNRDCILCTQCMKACPNDNVTFRLRKPFSDLFYGIKLHGAQIAFMIIVIGFAFYEVATEWSFIGSRLLAPFQALNAALGISAPWAGTVTAALLFFIIPGLLLAGITAVSSLIDTGKVSLSRLGLSVTAFIPLVATTHLAKSVVKSVSRFQNIPAALKDPIGIDTANALIAGNLQIGGSWQTVLNIIARTGSAAVLLGGFTVTVLLLMRFPERRKPISSLPLIMLASLYMLVTVGALIGSAWF